MTRAILSKLRRFRTAENGSMVPAVALWMPIFIMLIVSAMELGVITVRQVLLERALDQTMREVKLGNGPATHDSFKAEICEKAKFLPDCNDTLQLEMIPVDILAWSEPPMTIDCRDMVQPVSPQRHFTYGRGGQVVFLRACYKFKPISPTGGLNASLPKDGEGYFALTATTAFVNEPS
ncbi:TadE/TadG family type IV pilus assembly protein [Sagittula salina]|uniref:Pilus assembly protein n=1 Tax=Sagittula salina TaxID=2820268 RepID=A0A940RYY6_9RHOB|nr:pilus assembly protein [Sagittula salina]MBP0481398.1 pilus assembly protein [Sagittula salina]